MTTPTLRQLFDNEVAALQALLANPHKRASAVMGSYPGPEPDRVYLYPLEWLFNEHPPGSKRLVSLQDLNMLGKERYAKFKRSVHLLALTTPAYNFDPWAWELCVLALTPQRDWDTKANAWRDGLNLGMMSERRVELIRQVHLMRGNKRREAIDALLAAIQMLENGTNTLHDVRLWWRQTYGVFR